MDQENSDDVQANLPTESGAVQPNTSEQNNPHTTEWNDKTKNPKKKISIAGIITITTLSCALLIAIIAYVIIRNTWQYKDSGLVFYHGSEDQSATISEDDQNKKTDIKPSTTSEGLPDCSKIEDQAEIDVCETIASAARYLANKYYSAERQTVLGYKYGDYGPAFRPDYLLADTRLTPNGKSYTLQLNIESADYLLMEDFLLDQGFSRASNWHEENGPGATISYVNNSNDVICGYLPNNFSCSSMKFYPSQGSEDAKLINDLARVLENNDMTRQISLSVKDITNSSILPYQTIGKYMSFYRVNPDSEWIFGYDKLDVWDCQYYNNDDMRKAYALDECYSENNITTVKEYYNL